MASNKKICPECGIFALTCRKTWPTAFVGHDLESPRVSLWTCSACSARFQLSIPPGTLTRIKCGTPSKDICRKVLEVMGLSEKFPEFPIISSEQVK